MTLVRGCIGSLVAHQPLGKDVIAHAVDAATRDPRFNPVTAGLPTAEYRGVGAGGAKGNYLQDPRWKRSPSTTSTLVPVC
ncbi:AMMECR1 domain-containing protein [Bifidobacterium breve]|uniref:AMMECR1 domain-containing protein n=1 Tax=Bifidobacterium breve TaxID=1685 RepID=UPI0013DD9DCB|nr:AMMECR1 domain-containing protein [Bifidobacterium breve]